MFTENDMHFLTVKGPFKDEFVKAGGVPLSEVSLTLSVIYTLMCTHTYIH